MNIGFLITVRLKSTRLTRKVLLSLNGYSVIERVIQRAKKVVDPEKVVLCTSTVHQDLPLVKTAFMNNIFYFNNNQYLSALNKCDISITAGGLGLLDSIFMKKKVICIPRYNHQLINAKKIASKREINLLKVDDKDFEIKFQKIFKRIYKNRVYQKKIAKAYNTILSENKMNKTMKLIYNVYEQSIN